MYQIGRANFKHLVRDLPTNYTSLTVVGLDGSPGLVVIGGDSCSEGCWFKPQHCIQYGHISHLFVVKNVMFV